MEIDVNWKVVGNCREWSGGTVVELLLIGFTGVGSNPKMGDFV